MFGYAELLSTIQNGVTAVNNLAIKLTGFLLRKCLAANTTFYVRQDGSDDNDGLSDSASGAFLTPEHAIFVIESLDLNLKDVTLHIGSGTWTGTIRIDNLLGNNDNDGLTVEGNGSANTTVQIAFDNNVNANVRAMTISADVGDGFASLWSGEHCEVFIKDDVVFHSAAGCNTDIYTYDNGAVTNFNDYAISGAGARNSHCRIAGSGRFNCSLQATNVTVSDNPNYAIGFLRLEHHALVQLGNGYTSTGTATGPKFRIDEGGKGIITGASNNLPGDATGSTEYLLGDPNGGNITTLVDDFSSYSSLTIPNTGTAGGIYLTDVYGDLANTIRYGYLRLRIDDSTAGSEDATWHFGSVTAGTHTDTLVFSQTFASFGIAAFANFANDAAAAAGGIAIGQFYRNGSVVMVRVT